LIVPAWKPELASPKDIVDAIAVEWSCDKVFTAVEHIDIDRYPSAADIFG
jgi:hypothetical protein